MSPEPALHSTISAERLEFTAAGSWTIAHSEVLERLVDAAALQFANARIVAINMAGVQALDTLGAWLFERLIRRLAGTRTTSRIYPVAGTLSRSPRQDA